jgi:hypothetical protein
MRNAHYIRRLLPDYRYLWDYVSLSLPVRPPICFLHISLPNYHYPWRPSKASGCPLQRCIHSHSFGFITPPDSHPKFGRSVLLASDCRLLARSDFFVPRVKANKAKELIVSKGPTYPHFRMERIVHFISPGFDSSLRDLNIRSRYFQTCF